MAGDLKQDQKGTVPAVAATQMSDAEMDKVTAGEIMKIQQTLEREGISFIADPGGGIGVRLSRPERQGLTRLGL
jgi:hypothetical protein